MQNHNPEKLKAMARFFVPSCIMSFFISAADNLENKQLTLLNYSFIYAASSYLHSATCEATELFTENSNIFSTLQTISICTTQNDKLEMWANAQRDGRPAEYRWRPLFNAAVWLTPTTRLPSSNAAKTRNPLKLPGVPQTNERISAASGPKFAIL